MKILVNLILLSFICSSVLINNLYSQDWREKTIQLQDEQHKYMKDKYEETYEEPFEEVWQAVMKSIEDINCMVLRSNYNQNDEGLIIGQINTEHCTIAVGRDTTSLVLKYYSSDMPNVRAARWEAGRIKYRFILTEFEDGNINLEMFTQVSGHETIATKKYHFWNSNGIPEYEMFKRINRNLGHIVVDEDE